LTNPSQGGPPANLGLFRFTIEGRAAPGLFVAGWIMVLVGGSAAVVGLLGGGNVPATVLFVVGLAVLLVALTLLGGSQAIERRQAGLGYAGPSPILAFAALVVGLYLAAFAVGTPLMLLGLHADGPALALLGVTIQGVVVVVLLRLMVVGSGALTWHDMGVRRPDRLALREFARGALLALPMIFLTGAAAFALVTATGQRPASPLPPAGSFAGLLLNLLAAAVIAPLYEELFFRGFTLTAWRLMTGAQMAIVRSAVLFALVHALDQTGTSFSAAFGAAVVAAGARLPLALAQGWVFDRRRSLWAAIGLHATFNAILVLVSEQALLR